mgnify:CR=1 FL=1
MLVGDARVAREDSGPRLLRVIEHERHQTEPAAPRKVRLAVDPAGSRSVTVGNSLPSDQREEVSLENQAEHEQNQKAADSDVHPAKAAALAFVSTIFQIYRFSSRCPTHAAPLESNVEQPIIVGCENEFVTAGHASDLKFL